jgi:phage tail-like protein
VANTADETIVAPFNAFNFRVEIDVPGLPSTVCSAAFAECDGLEMTIEAKTIREGGNNGAQIRLAGAFAYGQLTLKRGMTASFDLWDWLEATLTNPELRGEAHVIVLAADGAREQVRFRLSRCLPIKLKAPALNAKDGIVAIEELQLAYEMLALERPAGGLVTTALRVAGRI